MLAVDPRTSGRADLKTPRIFVKAGPQRVSAAFLQRLSGVADDLVAPIEGTLDDAIAVPQLLQLPRLQHLNVTGPFDATRALLRHAEPAAHLHCRPWESEARSRARARS